MSRTIISQCINIYEADAMGDFIKEKDVYLVLSETEDNLDYMSDKVTEAENVVQEYFEEEPFGDTRTLKAKLEDLFPWGVQVLIK